MPIPEEEYIVILKETQAAIERGYDKARAEWKLKVLQILYETACEMEYLTVNDFRDRVRSLDIQTHDNRAMGGIMVAGKKQKWITPAGRTVSTHNKLGHLSPIYEWKSLLYGRFQALKKNKCDVCQGYMKPTISPNYYQCLKGHTKIKS